MAIQGDKIGIDTPTPGGSTGTWGTEYAAMAARLDEHVYSVREDRNLIVLGGGKISWDGAQITFDAAIDIRNHITAFKNSITTAASPRTLDAAHKVAYAAMTRKPSSDTNITSLTLVAAGSLPNGRTDADEGYFVVAYRTADSTVILPWARRELLTGDHWQFGASQTWYERIASHSKPRFYCDTVDTSQLVVPGTATAPSVVLIDGKIYANTANATLDLDTAGRNGLDTGAKAANTAYYLYAIPASSGRTFDVVCSITAPTTGPTGFSSWSYIGGFRTWASSALVAFTSARGKVRLDPIAQEFTVTSSTLSAKTIVMPTTVRSVWLRASYTTIQAAGNSMQFTSVNSATYQNAVLQVASTTPGSEPFSFFELPVLTANTVYTKTTSNSDVGSVYLFGWNEDPMEFK